ncbi:hypothetical protein RhiLY_04291 [Ceratobasidium sp. AG-Ba]|nr:hypothetical protein RhiLY_04291 [Ceratobasidium sp. AG-Ba]
MVIEQESGRATRARTRLIVEGFSNLALVLFSFSLMKVVLMIVAGRWFSILREDDSDYLSSCWLAQDCAEMNDKQPKLEQYIDYQIKSIRDKIKKEQSQSRRTSRVMQNTGAAQSPTSATLTHSPDREKSRPESSDLGGANSMPPEGIVNSPQRGNTGTSSLRRKTLQQTRMTPTIL